MVFFPCQHKCVCNSCIEKNNIGKPHVEGSWNFCSICNEQIKLALPHSGNEVNEYWKWVEEVKPPIPLSFIKSFTKRSTANIKNVTQGVNGDGGVAFDSDGNVINAGDKDGTKVCSVM